MKSFTDCLVQFIARETRGSRGKFQLQLDCGRQATKEGAPKFFGDPRACHPSLAQRVYSARLCLSPKLGTTRSLSCSSDL